MTPRLIVALDLPTPTEALGFVYGLQKAGITPAEIGLKIGMRALVQYRGEDVAMRVVREGFDLMLDLKLYDTADTVRATIGAAIEDISPRIITVHATPSVMTAAMAAARGTPTWIIAVPTLTDRPLEEDASSTAVRKALEMTDGIVIPPADLGLALLPGCPRDKLRICPGIRLADPAADGIIAESNNHTRPRVPCEAILAGATHLVVGRPIIDAADPAAVIRRIQAEMEEL